MVVVGVVVAAVAVAAVAAVAVVVLVEKTAWDRSISRCCICPERVF